jgi:hypothetical protein
MYTGDVFTILVHVVIKLHGVDRELHGKSLRIEEATVHVLKHRQGG